MSDKIKIGENEYLPPFRWDFRVVDSQSVIVDTDTIVKALNELASLRQEVVPRIENNVSSNEQEELS